ncbi:hypothetical protein AB0I28_06610 [Phytomonospora sp. NPDC050363]|uniref:hypothetical protein n=1 Tax=Phytomonospora sp. NPDC050363 TaxID=3155642 RepID=UPI0033D0F374
MALGEVVAQLVSVRGAIQTAIGLTANAADEATAALAEAEDALAGANHGLAGDGLDLWRRAQSGNEFTVAKLVAADEALAEYLEILSPGSGAGSRNADIAKPSGEELLKRSKEQVEQKSLFSMITTKADQVDDASKTLGKDLVSLVNIEKADELPPATGSGETISVEVGHRHHPVIQAPPTPAPDAGQILNLVLLGTAVGTKVVGKIKKATAASNRWRHDE